MGGPFAHFSVDRGFAVADQPLDRADGRFERGGIHQWLLCHGVGSRRGDCLGGNGTVFLSRFLKSGVATVPQYLELRFDHQTQVIANLIFLVAYVGILLPIILYTGARGMIGILDIQAMLGIETESTALWLIV